MTATHACFCYPRATRPDDLLQPTCHLVLRHLYDINSMRNSSLNDLSLPYASMSERKSPVPNRK